MKLVLGLLWWFVSTYPMVLFGIVTFVVASVAVATFWPDR